MLTGLPSVTLAKAAQTGRYGTSPRMPGPGEVAAIKYPGNGYGVVAVAQSSDPSMVERTMLARKAIVKAAQVALENDRPTYSFYNQGAVETGGTVRRVQGRADRYEQKIVGSRDGQLLVDTVRVPGTSGYSQKVPGYFAHQLLVQLWTREETVARGKSPADGSRQYDAEETYRDLAKGTAGNWPSLATIYSGVAERASRRGADMTTAERDTAMRNFLKLATVYARLGDDKNATIARERSKAFVRR